MEQESETISPSTEETVAASTEKDLSMKKIKATFDNKIHIATFMEVQELESWLEDLGEELVLLAINEAVKNNVRNMRYINTLLIDWRNQGFKTSSEVLYYIKNRKKKFNKSEPFEAANAGAYRVVEVDE